MTLDFSRPGKPTDNAFALRRAIDPLDQWLSLLTFNSRIRAGCMNAHWFLTLADAREESEAWRSDYNDVRPRGAIGHKTPLSLHYPGGATSPPP